jgi:hypothetical protein
MNLFASSPRTFCVIGHRFASHADGRAVPLRIALHRGVTHVTHVTQPAGDCEMADNDDNKPRLSPTALSLADAAKLLSKAAGQSISVEMLEADIAAGAPANADGTLNLVHYAAWLLREAARGD